jgi:ligand-binding sensor domain-containing protein
MKVCFLFLFVASFNTISIAQLFTNWQNHTDMKVINDVVLTGTEIISATGGGGFIYSLETNTFSVLHKSDGLNGITLTSVTKDKEGKIWFGSSDGVIDIYNPEEKNVGVILDIFNSNITNKSINSLSVTGDTLIVSSEFGVSLIDVNSSIFLDTFLKFGSFPSNTNVNSTLKSVLFYVCTNEGIAIQKQNATNLSAPESWDVYSSVDGLPSSKTLKAALYNGSLIVSTDKGFARFSDSTWSVFIPALNGKNISDFVVSNDSIIIISEDKLLIYFNDNLNEVYSYSETFNKLSFNNNSGYCMATKNGVVYLDPAFNTTVLIPNSPAANQFQDLTVDTENRLWSATGKDGAGVGYFVFDGEVWSNYNKSNQPALPTNAIYSTYTSGDGKIYLGTWGRGFLEIENENFTLYNKANTGMQGVPEGTDYIVITGFGNDSRNNLWVLNYWAADRRTLSMKTPEGNWHHFVIPAAQNRVLRDHLNLAVDPYDTKWFSSSDGGRAGLYYFNENKTYDDPTDDRSEYISSANGLNTNDVRAIVVDKRGDVWIGTSLGVNVITNTSTIPGSANPPLILSNVFTLRQQSINDMVVDPLNQKWIGTNEGLLLVNSDGSRLIATFTTRNSALLSDQIRTLAIDENAGILYVGTDNGLTSFETPYIKPLESFDELFVYPNPFKIKSGTNLLTIDGLISDTNIKILTIEGMLVAEFSSPGGRIAYWDGKDNNGELVSTGVYIIVAFDTEGNEVITGKVAVLRE